MRLSIFVTSALVLVLLDSSICKEKEDNATSSGEITILKKKKNHKAKSTSSSSGADHDSGSGDDESLGDDPAASSSSSSSENKKITKTPKYIPKSSNERKGWRKWHRKCKLCPEDMKKKWRDFSNKWICGAYQRARRTFKSKCMMEYRNCQDGTMFVKISGGRCKNETKKSYHGDHWFYEYKVAMSYESDDSKKSDTSTEEDSASSSD